MKKAAIRQIAPALIATLFLLSGCSTPPPLRHSADMQQHSWSGRLGLQVRDPLGPEQSFSAAFHLQGNPEQGRLDIFNPLGSQIAQLQWHPGGALLIQGDRYTPSQSLQELLRQSLGSALPVQALFSWLRGQPADAEGWQVDLTRHAEGRITAQRTSPPPPATLRIILQSPE